MENKIKVENRSGKYLVHHIPNTSITFIWDKPNAFVMLTKEQIKELYYAPGGAEFFKNLIIHDEKLRKELVGEVEPEYFYTEKEIDKILTKGSEDQLRDFIDFSPEGGIDLLIKRAIELKISDLNKREIIAEMTGHNIDNSIKFSSEDTDKQAEKTVKRRRSTPITTK